MTRHNGLIGAFWLTKYQLVRLILEDLPHIEPFCEFLFILLALPVLDDLRIPFMNSKKIMRKPDRRIVHIVAQFSALVDIITVDHGRDVVLGEVAEHSHDRCARCL